MAGGFATAIVAALIALVGVLVCRWTLGIPILAPSSEGAWGSVHTGEFVLGAALIALAATAVLYLLMLSTPQPFLFFRWIMGLATLAAVVYPFSTGAPLNQKAATAIVVLVLGIAITSLLTATAARAMRRVSRPDHGEGDYREPQYRDPQYRDPRYAEPQARDPRYPNPPYPDPQRQDPQNRGREYRDGGYREGPGAAPPAQPAPPAPRYEPYDGPENVRRN
ncbi:MAG TPA: DUF6069 family protein [Trebonia sp.]|nr:DUF6069 family protein [Trebonia sp.]